MIRKNYTTYLLIFIMLFINACTEDKKNVKKVACVGDSITYGHGINNREENCYPEQLEKLLGDEFDVQNFGVSGATLLKEGDLSYWNQPEFDSALIFNPDIVYIMLGTNDSKPWNWNKKEDYKKDYIALIQKFKQLNSKPEIFICNPPPAFKTRWGINDSIIRVDILPIIDSIAKTEKLEVIDFYAPCIDKGTCFPDFIHPDSIGASLIASTIANTIK